MSQQPRQVPTHPSSPSKSTSRRTTSGGGTISTQQQQPATAVGPATRSLLPTPQFEDDPIVASHQQHSKRPSLTLNNPEYSEHAVAESNYDSVSAHPPLGDEAIASFQPFFTLIEDSVTNEHHHPTVHYIFADDDADIIAEAALRSLEVLDPSQRAGSAIAPSGRDVQSGPNEDEHQASRFPQPPADTREHYIILDVRPPPQRAGQTTQLEEPSSASASASATAAPVSTTAPYTYTVSSAHSLSAEWQVLRTSISAAPTIGDNPITGNEGLMLRIEGRGNTPAGTVTSDKGNRKEGETAGEPAKESMEEMIERFQRRLEDIRIVLDEGGGVPAGDVAEVLEE